MQLCNAFSLRFRILITSNENQQYYYVFLNLSVVKQKISKIKKLGAWYQVQRGGQAKK